MMQLPIKFIGAVILCVAFTMCVCASPELRLPLASAVELRLEFDGTYLLVPVKIGNTEKMFIVDTAANATVISPATRDALGLTTKDGQIVDVTGAGGEVKYQAVELDSFGVGNYVRPKFGVVVIDLAKFKKKPGEPYAGILGTNFLSDFDVEIDLPASRLRLYPHDKNGNASLPKLKGHQSVPNKAADKGFVVLDVSVEGKIVTAILDTGAPASLLNWAAAKQAGISIETKGVKKRTSGTVGLGAQVADTYLYKFKRIEAGSTRFKAEELRIADLSVFKALGLSDKPAMLFGLDMLKKRALLISYRTKKIYFYKSAARS